LRIPASDVPGMPLRNVCSPREKSRLSMTFSTVESSGKPSKNFRVPIRVSTESGVVIDGGMGVVIFIFGDAGGLAISVGAIFDLLVCSRQNRGRTGTLSMASPTHQHNYKNY